MTSMRQKNRAFTIVELIVVIAVIGVIATVVLVGYSTVRTNAITSDIKSDLSNAYDQLDTFEMQYTNYPTTTDCSVADSSTNLCLKSSGGVTLNYQYSNAANPQTFCVTASSGSISYYTYGSTSTTGTISIQAGTCFPITSGLVANLDAGNSVSYNGSGTAITDLSGAGNNGTLTTGATFRAISGGGVFSLDGITPGYISTTYIPPSTDFTVSMAYKLNNSAYWASLWGSDVWTSGTGYLAYFSSATTLQFGVAGTAGISATVSGYSPLNFNIYTFVKSSTGNSTIYVNGNSAASGAVANSVSTNSILVGTRHANGGTGVVDSQAGYVGFFHVYNRALSATEVLQNFNAMRGRYGL